MPSHSTGVGRGRRGLPRLSPAQRERRRDAVVHLSNLGYWPDQIATALGVGDTTINADKAARRAELKTYGRGRHRMPRPKAPEPIDWISEPPAPPPKPAYWITGPLLRLQALRDYLRTNNARGALAFNLDEARQARDPAFRQEVSEVVAELTGRIAEMGEIVASDEARQAAKGTEAREDLRQNDLPRAWNGMIGEFKKLPVFGDNSLPTRYHAALWQEWFAGRDITDPKVISRVAAKEGSGRGAISPARVAQAAAELAPYLRMWERSMGRE